MQETHKINSAKQAKRMKKNGKDKTTANLLRVITRPEHLMKQIEPGAVEDRRVAHGITHLPPTSDEHNQKPNHTDTTPQNLLSKLLH